MPSKENESRIWNNTLKFFLLIVFENAKMILVRFFSFLSYELNEKPGHGL